MERAREKIAGVFFEPFASSSLRHTKEVDDSPDDSLSAGADGS